MSATARRRQRSHTHWRSFRRLVRLWVDLFAKHNLLTYASAIAFRSLVALVGLLLLATALLGELGRTDVWTQQIGPKIEPKVLLPVYSGIDATVQRIFESSSGPLIALAVVLAVWEISGVVRACTGALDAIYDTEDDRPWWIRFPLSIGLALVLTLALVGAVLLGTAAAGAVHGPWGIPFGIARWLLAVVLLVIAFGILVRYAPVQPRTTRWSSAGAALAVVSWVVQSLIFAEYLRFASYRSAAGALFGFAVLTTYLYVGAIVLLVAMELDEQLRKDVEHEQEPGIIDLLRKTL
jgi:membrane protein